MAFGCFGQPGRGQKAASPSLAAWHFCRISDCAEVRSGGTPATGNPRFWNGGIPWVTPSEIAKTGKYLEKTVSTISKEGLDNSSAELLPANTVIMCSRATIGPRAILKAPMTTNQGFKNFICKDNLDPEFWYYYLDVVIPSFLSCASGNTFKEVSKRDVEQTTVRLPPLSEQHRITAILSASDRVVESKQKLLEAKQSRKRALLQALFDPKDGIRISKFFGSWRSETLQGIGNFEKGHGITNSQCLSGDCPCVKYGDIYVCYDTHFSKAQSHTTETVFRESLRVEAGSLLFTCSGEEPLDIGKCVVYMGTEPIAVGGDILVFHSYKHDPLFLAYQQQTSPLIRQKASLAKGQSIFHIHLPEIQGLQVCVPPTIEEERAIAQTLLTADREIDGLAREINAWKEKRKALSQLLLSGKVRV